MVVKRFCDSCGAEIPDTVRMEHNEAVKHPSGSFHYGAIVCEELDDLCCECGAKVRDFIRNLREKNRYEGVFKPEGGKY